MGNEEESAPSDNKVNFWVEVRFEELVHYQMSSFTKCLP